MYMHSIELYRTATFRGRSIIFLDASCLSYNMVWAMISLLQHPGHLVSYLGGGCPAETLPGIQRSRASSQPALMSLPLDDLIQPLNV